MAELTAEDNESGRVPRNAILFLGGARQRTFGAARSEIGLHLRNIVG